jgi:hypothetical protein
MVVMEDKCHQPHWGFMVQPMETITGLVAVVEHMVYLERMEE